MTKKRPKLKSQVSATHPFHNMKSANEIYDSMILCLVPVSVSGLIRIVDQNQNNVPCRGAATAISFEVCYDFLIND